MHTLWRLIAGLLKWSWKLLNFARQFISNLLFIVFIVLVASGVLIYKEQFPADDSDYGGALYVNLSGTIVDRVSARNPLDQLGWDLVSPSSGRIQQTSLFDIVDSIRRAKNDTKITGMVLKLDDFAGADQASMLYIGKVINEFKSSGKSVIAIGQNYSQPQYYLASYADKILLTPQGGVSLKGYSNNHLFYKSLLENLKISTHIFRVGTYKSAVEPMMRNDMSDAARTADSLWLNELWNNYRQDIAINRKIPIGQVLPEPSVFIEKLRKAGGNSALYALQNGLVDRIAPLNVIEQKLEKKFGWDKKNQHFNYITINDYIAKKPIEDAYQNDGNIAVIVVEGEIMDGKQSGSIAGSDTIAEQLRQARLNPNIKAIILRVNSPGGSISASELIRGELVAIREGTDANGKKINQKPIVVSMGGLAASGGYWVSTPANYIIASPNTLTGSIGVFGAITTFEKSLDYLGVNTDGVSTYPLADISTTKGINPLFSEVIQMSIENGYSQFIGLVANSRHKTTAEIEKIAEGRVWSGSDAKKNGLVDQLGDFDDAVKKAAELAGLKTVSLSWMQPELSFTEKLMLEFSSSAQAIMPNTLQSMLPAPFAQAAQDMKKQAVFYSRMNDPQNIYAYCLNCSDIR
ncbi:signal peptide peptidase SppA [Xenorhabdus sp. KJ12.1]|uniref:signal peptide peptidase SppA n=1 Tax=Xenorhabdus sp. KJ12.1 TaxID=1851571 RepID=UPI000C03C1D6|nr:signal peptide peptidase SppA [Xenorhabdus sp. KJ12.1]PHM72822.1 signal peptide peptidase SppA [Xenorhabdus sp. KJ12.1]